MPTKSIQDRNDIFQLVNTFYGKVRQDEILGPIFNAQIAPPEWPEHLEKLTDFWEHNLVGTTSYKGSPTQAHIQVDEANDHQISQTHFHRWLTLWLETVDELFEGPLAERAKAGARKMATGQFIAIFRSRPS